MINEWKKILAESGIESRFVDDMTNLFERNLIKDVYLKEDVFCINFLISQNTNIDWDKEIPVFMEYIKKNYGYESKLFQEIMHSIDLTFTLVVYFDCWVEL